MDQYSTKFSETFRKIYPHEALQSAKKRNQEYWWQSRRFKETIECYGQFGPAEKYNPTGEAGPFCMYFYLLSCSSF